MNKTLCLAPAALLGSAVYSAERVSLFPSYKLKVMQDSKLDLRAVVSPQPGTTRDQVILLLGTPLLCDPFHVDRWGYTFNTSRSGVIKEQIDLTLYSENGLLVRTEGNAVQKTIEVVRAEQRSASGGQATAPLK